MWMKSLHLKAEYLVLHAELLAMRLGKVKIKIRGIEEP
jgi:hypothetical protein